MQRSGNSWMMSSPPLSERPLTLTGPLCITPAARKDQQAVRMVDILLFGPYVEDDLNTILNLMDMSSVKKWQ